MTSVGILNCSNMTQDIGCSSFGCLASVNQGTGAFERYPDGAELVGIINCSGCPTSRAPEKLLNRLRTLTEIGVEAIHFSACMLGFCPFRGQYRALIAEHFPSVAVVEGTHAIPEGAAGEQLVAGMKELLCERRTNMAEYIKEIGMMNS